MYTKKVLFVASWVLFALMIFFLLVLSANELLPTFNNNTDLLTATQIQSQIIRQEFLVKDIYILAYRGPSAHDQAVSDLQIQLPLFQQTQANLQNDATLSDAIKSTVSDAQPEFLAEVTAMKNILQQADTKKQVDIVQVDIVYEHDRMYVAAMLSVLVRTQQQAQTHQLQLLTLKMALISMTILAIVIKHFMVTRSIQAIQENGGQGKRPQKEGQEK